MTAVDTAHFHATSPASTATANPERLLAMGIGFQFAMMAISLLALPFDARTVNDISVWVKPLKFQASLALVMATVIWLLPLLDRARRASRLVTSAATVLVLACTTEIAYITLQSARGRASHFNDDTALENVLYSVMGVGAVGIVAACFIVGYAIWRTPVQSGQRGLHLGAAWGLMIGAVLTLVTAGIMSSAIVNEPGHWVGGIKSDMGGLPLLGWSRTGGDLRVSHFFATHIMQALPLLGLMVDRMAPGRAVAAILAGAALSVGVVGATFWQAVQGIPFWP